jgi:hypothetical protein
LIVLPEERAHSRGLDETLNTALVVGLRVTIPLDPAVIRDGTRAMRKLDVAQLATFEHAIFRKLMRLQVVRKSLATDTAVGFGNRHFFCSSFGAAASRAHNILSSCAGITVFYADTLARN